jgi:hypothetical protein
MTPEPNVNPHDSAHHKKTSIGDTFGGLGTDREFREEELPSILDAADFGPLLPYYDDV